jgi:hypothetical protein
VVGLKAELLDCGLGVKKDMAKLKQELVNLKQEIETMQPKPEPIAPLAADVGIPPAPKADPTARKSSNSNSPPPQTHFPLRRDLLQWKYHHHQPRRNRTRGRHQK